MNKHIKVILKFNMIVLYKMRIDLEVNIGANFIVYSAKCLQSEYKMRKKSKI